MEQRTDQWHKFRSNRIGGSDAPVIMGVSPWKTPYGLYLEKLGMGVNTEQTPSMTHGLEIEDRAREWFRGITGIPALPSVYTKNDWMMASYDGFYVIPGPGSQSIKVCLEIKLANQEDHECVKSGKVPTKYYPQVQHQIEVIDADKAYYLSWRDEDPVLITVDRDDAYIDDMVKKERKFWQGLQNLDPPEMTDRDHIKMTDPSVLQMVKEWKELQPAVKRAKELRELIVAASKDQSWQGGGVRASKVIRRAAIPYSSIPEIQSLDLESYRPGPIETWRLSEYQEKK